MGSPRNNSSGKGHWSNISGVIIRDNTSESQKESHTIENRERRAGEGDFLFEKAKYIE